MLPLLASIVPLVAVHLAYWLGIESGRLPSCIPYLDGCTSISSTGRHPPGSLLFKGVHLPFAALLAVVWYLTANWLHALAGAANPAGIRRIMAFGLIGAGSLIIYTTYLGTTGPVYEFMRRFGIYFYFIGTVFAQLGGAIVLRRLAGQRQDPALARLAGWMLVLCAIPFALGVLNFVLKAVLSEPDMTENRIEWIVAVAMQAWFLLLYFAWRRTGIAIEVRLGRSRGP